MCNQSQSYGVVWLDSRPGPLSQLQAWQAKINMLGYAFWLATAILVVCQQSPQLMHRALVSSQALLPLM